MNDPSEEPEYIDAEIVEDDEPSLGRENPKLLGPFAGLKLIDDEQGRNFLTELKRQGVPIISPDFTVANISTGTMTHGPNQADVLSKVLYEIAKLAERVNMSPANEAVVWSGRVNAEPDQIVGDVMEQIIVLIAKAPLTQEYAMRMAAGK